MPDTSAEHVAVVLAPGIFASHLVDPGGGMAWPINRSLQMIRHLVASPSAQRAAFHEDKAVRFLAQGPTGAVSAAQASAGFQNIFLESYRPFLEACAGAGPSGSRNLPFEPHPFALGYNFTRSNAITAWRTIVPETLRILEALRKRLGIPAQPRFIFVTHSMGALAVRYALLKNPALQKRCICVIHVAAPNAGAPETLLRFIRGSKDKPPVSTIFGDEGWKCLTSASTIGAGLELLPYGMWRDRRQIQAFAKVLVNTTTPLPDGADPFPDVMASIIETQLGAGSATRKLLVTGGTGGEQTLEIPDSGAHRIAQSQKAEIAADIQKHLTRAAEFHEQLRDWVFERTGFVALGGVATVQGIEVETVNGLLVSARERVSNDGDGTVPLSSQLYPKPRAHVTASGLHFVAKTPDMTGVEHVQALGDRASAHFPSIFELMSKLYQCAPRGGVEAPVRPSPVGASTTLLAALRGAQV